MTRAPLEGRLEHLAIDMQSKAWEENVTLDQLKAYLLDHAYSLSEFAQQVHEEYVRADDDGEIPTNAQGIALARFLRPQFREGVRDAYATVARGGFDLPNGYIQVRLADGYRGGIDRDGRTST